jgi:hypothetical protein
MLNNINKLYFPKLVFNKNITFGNTADCKLISLYTLDWNRKEHKCNPSQSDDIVELGPFYEQTLKNLKFALSDSYIKEIRRTSWKAVEEYNINRNDFHPNIKEYGLLPANSYISVAFKLMSDSIFDEETGFYLRGDIDKMTYHKLLLTKFWINQTNGSNVWKRAELREMELFYAVDPEQYQSFEKILDDMEKLLK